MKISQVFPGNADPIRMINPISSGQPSHFNQVSQPAARQPQTQAPSGASLPKDTVALKSTGDANHDGDSH